MAYGHEVRLPGLTIASFPSKSVLFARLCGRRLPLVAQQAHQHEIVVFARAPDVGALATFLDKAAGAVGADSAFVVAPDAQPDFAPVAQPEGVVGEQGDRLAAVTARPVFFV